MKHSALKNKNLISKYTRQSRGFKKQISFNFLPLPQTLRIPNRNALTLSLTMLSKSDGQFLSAKRLTNLGYFQPVPVDVWRMIISRFVGSIHEGYDKSEDSSQSYKYQLLCTPTKNVDMIACSSKEREKEKHIIQTRNTKDII